MMFDYYNQRLLNTFGLCFWCICSGGNLCSYVLRLLLFSQNILKTLLHCMGLNRQIESWEAEVGWLSAKVNNRRSMNAILGFLFVATAIISG